MRKYSTGKLELRIQKAKLVHDTQLIGKMDTICKFKWNQKSYHTKICKDGGKEPKWDDFKEELELREHLDNNDQGD